jgi:hypothetical protein
MFIVQPIKEEEPQENELFSNTNKSEKQRSDCWTYCWRNILDGLMHSSDVQEGAAISTCIRDALLYGGAQLGTVSRKNNSILKSLVFLCGCYILSYSICSFYLSPASSKMN